MDTKFKHLNVQEMSSDEASWLFEKGSFVIVLDMPMGTQFGIDCNSWKTDSKFKGLKMIPPGFHYIQYSAKIEKCHDAPRIGIMKFFKPQEFLVLQWNSSTEELCDVKDSSDLVERLKANKKELDRFLGVYPYESLEKWISLTDFIQPKCVARVRPTCGNVYSASMLESKPSNSQTRMQNRMEETPAFTSLSHEDIYLPNMKPIPGTELKFTKVPDLFPNLVQEKGCDSILSELQLSFICFLTGHVYEAFEQWKILIVFLCKYERVIEEYPELFSNFIRVLHYQINEIDEDFFVDIITKDNFLSTVLPKFFENIQVSNCPQSLKRKSDGFRKNLEKRFNWSFECETGKCASKGETGDDAPTVAELY